MKYNLFCFGKANTDYVAKISDEKILEEYGLKKGTGKEVSKEVINELEKKIKFEKTPGGSTANVAHGFANISRKKGLKVAYATSIGNDSNGKRFEEDMKNIGIDCYLKKIEGPSPVCIALITPDAERTFAVSLGVSTLYLPNYLPYEAIKNSEIFHTDGYEILSAKEAVFEGITLAKKYNKKISFDIANEKIAKNKRNEVLKIILDADFIFANEKEFKELVKGNDLDNGIEKLNFLKKFQSIIVKLGSKGAFIFADQKYEIPIYPAKAIDTNGAGDAFAAGFLYGQACKYDKEFSGKIGSYYASKLVEKLGPRLKEKCDDIEKEINLFK